MSVVADPSAAGARSPATRPRDLALMIAGLLVWSLAFLALYVVQAIGCPLGWHRIEPAGLNLHRLLLLAVWGAHLLALAWLIAWSARRWRHRSREPQPAAGFVLVLTLAIAWVGLLATVWTGLPIVLLPTC
jgi:hypothetical protein